MTMLASIRHKTWRKTALKAGFGVCVAVGLGLPFSANAQSIDGDVENADTPLTATATTTPAEQKALPEDLQPENLLTPKVRNIDPERVKRLREESRNRWDPATLTQSTGLSAASLRSSVRRQSEAETTRIQARPVALDVLSSQDLLSAGQVLLPVVETVSAAPPRGDGIFEFGSSIRGALFDTPASDNVNRSAFKLDHGERLCLGTAEECQANSVRQIDVGYAKNITHGKTGGLNLQLTPRAGIRFDEESKSALVGALVRIGDNLRGSSEVKSNTWYFFAGADAEAISYTPNSIRSLNSGEFHLQERVLVGDAQAGLGYRIGSADLTFTYFKRQASAENYRYNEDAAALTITVKR